MRRQGERPELIRWWPCGTSKTWSFVPQRRMKMFRALRTLIMVAARARGRATLGSRTRPQRSLDNAPFGGWVEITLTETPDTDPCTQAHVSCRNGDYTPGELLLSGVHPSAPRVRLGSRRTSGIL